MGNRLTVANATDGDLHIYASEIDLELKKVDVDCRSSSNIEMVKEEVKLGWVSVAPSKAWTFPQILFARYFLTVIRKGLGDLIASSLKIPWHSNVIVTPDNKLAYAVSGNVWVDSSDLTDYRPSPKKKVDSVLDSTTRCDVDTIDGTDVLQPNVRAQREELVNAFREQNPNIPAHIADFFVNRCFDLGVCDVDNITQASKSFFTLLGVQLSQYAANGRDPDMSVLAEILKQEVFNIPNVDDVINDLSSNEHWEVETMQYLRKLMEPAAESS